MYDKYTTIEEHSCCKAVMANGLPRVYLIVNDGTYEHVIAEVIGNAEDFYKQHGNIQNWIKSISKRKLKRINKINLIVDQLQQEKNDIKSLLDLLHDKK